MDKNLLSDTDYTKGWDNRFGVTAVVGQVSKIECTDKAANVRVIMPDRVDHQDQPLISKPVPVLQIASTAKKSFAVPRLNDYVLCIKLPNGTSNYAILGSFYTETNPPPVSDPMLDYVEFDDGSTMQFDASKGELTWKLKGNMLWDNQKDFTFKTQGKVDFEIQGDVTIKSQGKVDIEASSDLTVKAGGNLALQGTAVNVNGNPITLAGIVHTTADMHTDGRHTDSLGPHAAARREEDLLARIAALEQRVAALEARHGS